MIHPRPMPKHAERYLFFKGGQRETTFFAWMLRSKPRTPASVRRCMVLPVCAIILYCALADHLSLQWQQLEFRTVDRYATRFCQVVILFGAMMLAVWVLGALLSGAFSLAVR